MLRLEVKRARATALALLRAESRNLMTDDNQDRIRVLWRGCNHYSIRRRDDKEIASETGRCGQGHGSTTVRISRGIEDIRARHSGRGVAGRCALILSSSYSRNPVET